MSNMRDNEDKMFRNLTLLILLWICFITAWILNGKDEIKATLKEVVEYGQTIRHATK
jgi:hypothetical protein